MSAARRQKRDILACAPTGSGKTLSFVLPLLAMYPPRPDGEQSKSIKPTTIVIEPTRELAMQVLRETQKLASGGGWHVSVLGEGQESKKRKTGKDKKRKGKKINRKDEDGSSDESEVEEALEPASVAARTGESSVH